MKTDLATERLFLRSVCPTDAASVAALMTPAVSQWLTNFGTPFSRNQANARIRRILDAEAEGHASVYAFELRADTALAGWFGVYLDSVRSAGVLGYWLGEPYQGKGLMREGAALALASAERRLAVKTIEAYIHPHNEPSLALARSLGLHPVGEKMVYASVRDRYELCIRLAKP